ncbi:unnamed protein product [Durusdinium trenchii]|uniref:Uncharacterized protein n=1 Tax=Durusdinium trenchii TaxID=1381693 RepID=A0ABP0MYC5_9DINO
MLSYAQSNVAKGKVPSDKAVDTASLQQAFTIGGGASGHTGFSMKGLSPFDSLLQRLDTAGADLPSEDRKDLQQQITSFLPKLEPGKAADLVGKLQAADGLRSAAFLDEVCKLLPASRFTSPHLTRILAVLANWAAAVSGSDADGKPKLSEDARSFFTTSAAELSLRLMDVAPRDLSQIANAMATIGQTEERFFASLARASVARCERFAAEEILLLCLAFDKANLVHVPLLEAAAKLLRHQVSQVSGEDLSKGLKSLATCCVRDLELGRSVGEHLAQGPKGRLSPEEFCSLAWTFVTLGFYHDQMFRAVFKALEDAPSMPGDTLCQLYEIHLALKAFREDLYGKYELEESLAFAVGEAIAFLAAASAREAQLDATDQVFLKRLQACHGDCDSLRAEYEKSRRSLQSLEEETLKRATKALAPSQRAPGARVPGPLHSHVSKRSKASTESNLHKFVLVASVVGLVIAAFFSPRWLQQANRLLKLSSPSERTPILSAV